MNDVLLWTLKLIIGVLILVPIIGGTGCAWIDHWYKVKSQFLAQQAKAQSEALKSMAEYIKNDSKRS